MSVRVAEKPIEIPVGVDINVADDVVTLKGAKGQLTHTLHKEVQVSIEENILRVSSAVEGDNRPYALMGTTRALLNNNVQGVTEGFSKKLKLVGVGYRAQLGKTKAGLAQLDLTLGLSHPVLYVVPEGIELVVPTQTDIEVRGIDKQKVGQVAADIRGVCGGIRRPEPYKGKGIRYADEVIVKKETKK